MINRFQTVPVALHRRQAVGLLPDSSNPGTVVFPSRQPEPVDYERISRIVRAVVTAALTQPPPIPLRIGPAEMAERLGIDRRTLGRWMRRRLIPFERIGGNRGRSIILFEVAAVDAALRKWRTKSVGD